VLGIYALWPEERRNRYNARTAVSKIDFLGNLLLAVASILLVFAMQEAGSFVWSWSNPVIIWSLSTAGVCWAFLALWEYYLFYGSSHGIQPIFPMRLAKDRVYLLCLLYSPTPNPGVFALLTLCSVTFLSGFVYIALVIKIPEYLQVIEGDNALWAGVHLLPMLGSCAFGSFLGGAISKRANFTSQTLILGSVIQVLGLAFVFGFAGHLGLGLLLGFTAIYGLGVGLSFAACTMIAAIEARNDDLAAAQGAVAQGRVFGGAIGLAICTIIFNERLRTSLGPGSGSILGPDELEKIHRNLIAMLAFPDDVRLEVIRVYLEAFRDQMLVMTIVAAAALLGSFGTYRSGPGNVVDVMIQHKDFAGRPGGGGDIELSSASSVRSLVR